MKCLSPLQWPHSARLLSTIAALCIIVASLIIYQSQKKWLDIPIWQVHHFDHADYRFVAEEFWGVEHDLSSYDPEFSQNWGQFLSVVPFREIGIGTFYIITEKTLIIFLHKSTIQKSFPIVFPWLLKTGLCLSILILFITIRRLMGVAIGLLTVTILSLSLQQWVLTEEMLSEPFLRIMFLLLLSYILVIQTKPISAMMIIYGVLLLTTILQIKSQWMLLVAFTLLPIALRVLFRKHYTLAIACFLGCLLIPATLIFVHWWGWGMPAISSGTALHVNYKTGGKFAHELCAKKQFAGWQFCQTKDKNTYWNLFVGNALTTSDYKQLDQQAMQYILSRPAEMLQDFFRGLWYASNFPLGFSGNTPFDLSQISLIFRVIDIACYLLLALGLIRSHTRLLALFGLSLWVIPALGGTLAGYATRYHRPMAGIPLVIAILIIDTIFFEKYNCNHR